MRKSLIAFVVAPLLTSAACADRQQASVVRDRAMPAKNTVAIEPAGPTSAPADDEKGFDKAPEKTMEPSASASATPAATSDMPATPPPRPVAVAPMERARRAEAKSADGIMGALGSAAAGAGGGFVTPSPTMAFIAPTASIAAGEWNDNANYHEFQKWIATERGVGFRPVDVSHRRFLVVRDSEGKPVPGCRVDVADEGQRVSLTTGPSGRALLFPRAEGLTDATARVTANCGGGEISRAISFANDDDLVDLKLPVARHLPDVRTIDVAFILDTTGSMSEEIASVKSTIAKVAAGLGNANVEVRIGLVEYKDRGDAFVTRVHPFSNDASAFAASVAGLSAGGGGDTPESVNEGIHVALTGLDWQGASLGHFAFLIGDAPPHLDYAQDFSYAADMRSAAHRGIQIFTVAASGMDVLGQVVFRQIAQYTNASNMFVLRGGAGPQSTGAGDPRSSCGKTHDNYTSGHLDALILGKIQSELHALDGDPMRIAGLKEDEDVKPCDQRIVMQ